MHDLPWTVSVPVRESTFVPITPKFSAFNIEVDLSKIQSFSNGDHAPKPSDLLQCDLQTNADGNVGRRLGSGRAGFYRKHFVKGVGRTLLAGNWDHHRDLYHSSGLLLPSAGIREYLVSELFKRKRSSRLIVSCPGILFKKMPNSFRNHSERLFAPSLRNWGVKDYPFPKINSSFQAITVKKGGFFRFSNFAWWILHYPQVPPKPLLPLAYFFKLFYRGLSPSEPLPDVISPEMIAKRFAEVVDRTVENFLDVWELGIYWSSFHNNFAMDGRFLDLETPQILPSAMLSAKIDRKGTPHARKKSVMVDDFRYLTGFEVILYLEQVTLFKRFLVSRLDFLSENRLLSRGEAEFSHAVLNEFKKAFNQDHVLGNVDVLEERVLTRMTRVLQLDNQEKTQVSRMISSASEALRPKGRRKGKPMKPLRLVRTEGPPMAPTEPHTDFSLFVPEFLQDRARAPIEMNLHFNRVILEAEKMVDLDRLFEILRKA